MISTKQIENSKFEHFRWLDSPISPINDQVVKKFTQDMKEANVKKNFVVVLNSVGFETACDFVEVVGLWTLFIWTFET